MRALPAFLKLTFRKLHKPLSVTAGLVLSDAVRISFLHSYMIIAWCRADMRTDLCSQQM